MAKKIDCSLKKNRRNKKCLRQVGEAIFSIIIPKADNSRNKINPSKFNKYISKINKRFGGSTTNPITLGCWVDKKRKELTCESGIVIKAWRDFDSDPSLLSLDMDERVRKLKSDFRFMNRLAKESAVDFGQDSIPVIFDNVSDIKLNKGIWKKSINKSKLTGKKIPRDLWGKHI